MDVLAWLLDSDPALRWQVLRDVAGAPAAEVVAERERVATSGWSARLLAARDPDGQWAGGACFPAGFTGDFSAGQPWTSTLPVLELLRQFGVPPQSPAVQEAIGLVARNCRWEYDGAPFFAGEVEPCINRRVVGLGAYFGRPVDGVVQRLLGEQLADGGWNCEAENGSVRSSFHTTICVLEGLLEYENAAGRAASVTEARLRGEEYLLERRLMHRLTTGRVVDESWLLLAFPTYWHYDVLRGLEYFRAADRPDPRLAEAAELVRRKQRADGTWALEHRHRGAVHFELDEGVGTASRWNTLRAMRALRWLGVELG